MTYTTVAESTVYGVSVPWMTVEADLHRETAQF